MRRLVPAVLLAAAACTTGEPESAGTIASSDPAASTQPGGIVRQGASFASMSRQYTARAGPLAATGASAWVPPAPAAAFVAAGPPPPADPAAPDPLEAAISRSAAPGAPDPALRTAGLALFGNYGCGTCHALADAGATGSIGPSLDRNPRLARALAVDVISHGQGAMPAFAGQMSAQEIATLADYLVAFAQD
jgi:mono/diheme cytochrome c family protein